MAAGGPVCYCYRCRVVMICDLANNAVRLFFRKCLLHSLRCPVRADARDCLLCMVPRSPTRVALRGVEVQAENV